MIIDKNKTGLLLNARIVKWLLISIGVIIFIAAGCNNNDELGISAVILIGSTIINFALIIPFIKLLNRIVQLLDEINKKLDKK